MTHKIINQQKLDANTWRVTVQLFPENENEIKAIHRSETATADDTERELIDNYLNFNLALSDYAVVALLNQNKTIFILTVFIENN